MGRSRADRRAAAGAVNLYHYDWRVLRQLDPSETGGLVAAGAVLPAYDSDSNFIGYVMAEGHENDFEMLSGASAAAINASESKMNAGLYGRSRTFGLSEPRRLARHAKFDDKRILPAEDAIERAQAKVRLWPYPASRVDDGSGKPVYGDRAVRLYPRALQ